MNVSHPSVHPVEVPPPVTDAGAAQFAESKDEGHPRHAWHCRWPLPAFLPVCICRCSTLYHGTTNNFPSVTAFRYLVTAVGLQSFWSLSLAIVDIYALLVGRCLQNYQIVSLVTFGDGVNSTLTFSAAYASAGITVLLGNDLGICSQNHCTEFETATAMAFLSWFAALASFILNFWSLASR